MSAQRLAGRIAVVTGASRGIGAAVTRAYAAEGAAVAVVCEPRPEPAEQGEKLAAELRASGARAVALTADLADPAAIEQLVTEARQELGSIDIVVNNAAASPRADWREMRVVDWDYVQQVNVRAGWLLCRAAYPDLRVSAGGGVVINVSSIVAETGGASGALHYTTSKAGVIGLTRALAREVGGDGVRVNAVMPGAIRTEDEEERQPDAAVAFARVSAKQSLPRRGFAADVAGAFVFLASADSSFMTGQVVNVDGGWVHY